MQRGASKEKMLLARIYKQRSTKYQGLWKINGWRFKIYCISAMRAVNIPRRYAGHVRDCIKDAILNLESESTNYKAGFCGVHLGTRGVFVFVDWWIEKKELCQKTYYSYYGDNFKLEQSPITDPIGCVWDINLVAQETKDWVVSTKLEPSNSSIQTYLNRHFKPEY
jgi:hypothetical protein